MSDWYEIRNADEIPSPGLLLYPDRIRENLRRMIELVGDVRKLRPHVKTHKLPQVIAMKLEAGISKFKVSTIAEAEMTAAAGGKDILLAYQPVGPNISRLIRLIEAFPNCRFSTVVDNIDTLRQVSDAATKAGALVSLFVDLNVGMNRTGIALGEATEALYRRMASLPGIVAAGLHAYDGHLHGPELDKLEQSVEQVFAPVFGLRDSLRRSGLSVPCIVASGTPTSRFLSRHAEVEVGAGTTVLWDFGQTEISPDLSFLNAAVLLARVISKPTFDRVCIDVGHKSVASEMPHPRVRFFGLENAKTISHSEEHLVLESPDANRLCVGEVLYGIPRHVCPTVALHNFVWCVQDQTAKDVWPIVARTRCITI